MTALATRESPSLTEYKPQGLGHILKLSAIVTAGTILISVGGNVLFAVPLALATVYQMFRSTGKVKDADWCQSRDELWNYQVSPKHKSIADSYFDWCKDWGKGTINSLIEPMIGNCELCNFTQDKKHPYHGLRGILTFDDGESVPLTPHDYVSIRLSERVKALEKRDAIEVSAIAVSGDSKALNSADETTQPQDLNKLFHLFRFQSTLVWGGQGSGKTSLVRAIATDKIANNQKIFILNPHGNASGWQGMTLVGGGKNYSAIEAFMERYLDLIKRRYKIFEGAKVTEDEYLEQLLRADLVETTICEELSGWSTNVDQDLLHEFIRTALTESRKVGMPMILVAHDPSLEFVGLKKGARLRDKGVIVAEMESGIADLDTGFLKATGKGKLQIPGRKDAIAFFFTQPTMEQLKAEGIAAPAISENLFAAIAQPEIIDLAQSTQVYPVEFEPTDKQKLEEAFKVDIAEPTAINEVEAIADPIDALLLNYADDPKTAAFLKWISGKPSGEVVTREQIRCSYWAKQNGRDKESIDLVLIEAMDAHLLIETAEDFYEKRDIGTSGT